MKKFTLNRRAKAAATIASFCFILVALFILIPDISHASTATGVPLDDTYSTLVDWTQGSIGKVITLTAILVGIVAGIARQSLLAFAVGIGIGLGLYNAPGIVDTIFTATL